jgi:DNA-binding Lrp family transcriptional regulator
LKKLDNAHTPFGKSSQEASSRKSISIDIETPYDDLFPSVTDTAVQFYLDAMRIYLGMCAGTVSMEEAVKAVDRLKTNPEYVAYPTNPTFVPINEVFKKKVLENLKTLSKFNLLTRDSVRSAYTFAFLIEDVPIAKTDIEVLKVLVIDPTISLVKASEILEMAPRTIARALDRIRDRHFVRFSAILDYTAFNIQSAMLFFTLQEDVNWDDVEQGLSEYGFTKSLLKTTMTDLGYVSFMIPNREKNLPMFHDAIRAVSKTYFDYSSLHYQTGSGVKSNLSLFEEGRWNLAGVVEAPFDEVTQDINKLPVLLMCKGVQPEFGQTELAVGSQLQLNVRAPPSLISKNLAAQDWDIDARRVSQVIHKLYNRSLILPYTVLASLELSSNFCFEIVCNESWRDRILSTIVTFPWTMYYLSARGIIVWTSVPAYHQVEYYQVFRALQQMSGVDMVQPILTISQRGSRSTIDLTRNWEYEDGVWSVKPEHVDLRQYLPP